jgi:regulator of sigma E protease
MHEFLVSALAFIVLIGIMVVVHEFGHFAVAKLCGVRVESFSVGFGPRLFGIKHGDTDYKVCLLPLGGYVKMTGETPDQISTPASTSTGGAGALAGDLPDDPAAFSSHPRWQRMLIGVAGPASNFILAFVLMLIYFAWINEVPDIKSATLEWVTPGSAADQAGLQTGDVFRQFGNTQNPDLETVVDLTRSDEDQTVPVAVDRNGKIVRTALHVPDKSSKNGFELSQTGMFLQYVHGPIGVDQTVPNSPADQAGLKGGDSIVAVDGHAFHTVEPLLDYLQQGKG